VIADALDGKRILVTGTTGFLGTALLERLLRCVPGCEVVLLVRPGRRTTAAQRVAREVLRNDAFDRLRDELGTEGYAAMTARRVRVVGGDVGTDGLGLDDAGRDALATCDVVIHSAATVAFDSPLDSAVEVNLLGPMRVAEAIAATGSPAHLVAVSTCYVAGNRRGRAPELPVFDQPFTPDVSWRPRSPPPVDPCRRRGREPDPRPPRRLRQGGPPGAGRRRHAPPRVQGREGQGRLGRRPAGRGRPGPLPLARVARRVRLHQGAR
jgi:hypothetical protein